MTKIEFRAHNAGIGDCFSIKENNKLYVVDGGNENRIIQDFVGETIVVCVVTHNDRDHTHGILKMLQEESKVTIEEIWLPGIWQPILDYIYNNPDVLSKLKKYTVVEEENNEKSKFELDNLVENTNQNLNLFFEVSDLKIQYIELYRLHTELIKHYPEKYFNTPNIDLNRILGIFALALERGCIIRFFFPSMTQTSTEFNNYPFRMLNATELVTIKKTSEKNFLQLLYLSKENKFSLVFEYRHSQIPAILFTADSDLYFGNDQFTYNNEIIVTAPHHGSESNKDAYTKISQNMYITWVKSGGSMKCLTGATFQKLNTYKNKFCSRCKTRNIACNFNYKEIILEYKNSFWVPKVTESICLRNIGGIRRNKLNCIAKSNNPK